MATSCSSLRSNINKSQLGSLDPQIRRWFLVGISTKFIDWCLFSLLFALLKSVVYANLISAIIATTSNHLLHHYWTFSGVGVLQKTTIRFFLWTSGLFCIETITVRQLVGIGSPALLAKAVTMVILVILSFAVLKRWVYQSEK